MTASNDLATLADELRHGIPEIDLAFLSQLPRLFDLVEAGNLAGNLTRIRDWQGFLSRHVTDSLLGLAAWPALTATPLRVADVGCGAGFPGLVLAMACPLSRFVEIDSNGRKVDFVRATAGTLGLGERCLAVHGRARELGRLPEYQGAFDLVVARAVADAGDLVRECRRLLAPGGGMLLYKTPAAVDTELAGCRREAAKAGLEVTASAVYHLPRGDGQRQFLLVHSPRRTGDAQDA